MGTTVSSSRQLMDQLPEDDGRLPPNSKFNIEIFLTRISHTIHITQSGLGTFGQKLSRYGKPVLVEGVQSNYIHFL